MTRTRPALIVTALILATVLASAAVAAPNDGRFKKSAEGMKKQLASVCTQLKDALDTAEYWADQNAGTKDAKVYADEADALWAAGEKSGCSWAK